MDYVLKYRLFPDEVQREQLDWVRNTVRQLSNHALHRFNRIPETEGTVKQRVTQVRNEIPDLKEWWTDISNIYSTVLQQAVEQIATNIENLGKLKQQGFDVGSLNWKKLFVDWAEPRRSRLILELAKQSECIELRTDSFERLLSLCGFRAARDDDFARPEQEQHDVWLVESVDETGELLGFVLDGFQTETYCDCVQI